MDLADPRLATIRQAFAELDAKNSFPDPLLLYVSLQLTATGREEQQFLAHGLPHIIRLVCTSLKLIVILIGVLTNFFRAKTLHCTKCPCVSCMI